MDFLHTQKSLIYKGENPILLRGMGLGGWLLPEGYMWKFYTKCDRPRKMEALIEDLCGKDYATSFWNHYYDSYITEKDIVWIAEHGMNSVRLPINSRTLFETNAEGKPSFRPNILYYIDSCIEWCRKREIYVVLDMHGAPGGQTGQNIDDSENDMPELFIDESNQHLLMEMWKLLAERYKDNPTVGGYDLLNEPLPKFFKEYSPMLLPLYRKLISEIRQIDERHIIILEGLNWSTDFSVFDDLTKQEAANNIVLQFHKYWSSPDEESLITFLNAAKRLDVPLWMGEGGENNLAWYTTVFPMYENLKIGWCFWSYKKMETPNSPVTFAQPEGWESIMKYLDGGEKPNQEAAVKAFDGFIDSIRNSTYHSEVISALFRKAPVLIPAEAFDAEHILSKREPGVSLRMATPASLLFADGHMGEGNWNRYGGEPQPKSEQIILKLSKGDCVGYRIQDVADYKVEIRIHWHGNGELSTQFDKTRQELLWVCCISGTVNIESIEAIRTE